MFWHTDERNCTKVGLELGKCFGTLMKEIAQKKLKKLPWRGWVNQKNNETNPNSLIM